MSPCEHNAADVLPGLGVRVSGFGILGSGFRDWKKCDLGVNKIGERSFLQTMKGRYRTCFDPKLHHIARKAAAPSKNMEK